MEDIIYGTIPGKVQRKTIMRHSVRYKFSIWIDHQEVVLLPTNIAIPATVSNAAIKTKDIQIGDSTHHQDHAITPHSFSAIKSTVKRVASPGPAAEICVLFSFMSFFPLFRHVLQRCNRFPIVVPVLAPY